MIKNELGSTVTVSVTGEQGPSGLLDGVAVEVSLREQRSNINMSLVYSLQKFMKLQLFFSNIFKDLIYCCSVLLKPSLISKSH